MMTQIEAQILALEFLESSVNFEDYAIERCWETPEGTFQFQAYGPLGPRLINISPDGSESFGAYHQVNAEERFLLALNNRATQPRAPKGSPNGGQWIKSGGGHGGADMGGRDGGANGSLPKNSGQGSGVSGGGSTPRRLQLKGADGKVRDIQPVGVIKAPTGRALALQAEGLPTPAFYELSPDDADVFRTAISTLKEGNPWAASVDVQSIESYQGMRLFITDDGTLGGALDGDTLVSGFSLGGGKYKGGQRALIAARIAAGGRRSDSFDTILPHSYAKEGLTVVSRISWNDEYSPEGWDKAQYSKWNGGEPDVVLYAYDASKIGVPYEPNQGQRFTEWDDAAAAVDAYLAST